MSTSRDLAQINELAPRLVTYYTAQDLNNRTIWDRMYDDMAGHPSAASWDSEPRSDPVHCWPHQRDVSECHAQGLLCMGDPMSGPGDPTGQAGEALAARRGDAAADDERRARDIIRQMARLCVELEDIGTRHPPARDPSPFEREQSSGNEPQCESCARFRDDRKKPYWSPPRLNGSNQPYKTTRGDILPQPMYLCRTCDNHTGAKGKLPSEREIRSYHDVGKLGCQCPDVQEGAA